MTVWVHEAIAGLYEPPLAALRDGGHFAATFAALNEPVEIWTVPLDPPEPELRRLHALLSGEERRRAGSPPFPPRKRRYVARQGALREILARYAAVEPQRLELVRSNRGKPMLSGGDLHFSVSDSADLALVAVARREVGVDVEQVRKRAASERAGIGTETFFQDWTRLEAIGKARGLGLVRPGADSPGLACASVDVGPGFAAAVAVVADAVDVRLHPY
jgi:4'-phosphopantetheinyl transferase